jgi:hypothetical protein
MSRTISLILLLTLAGCGAETVGTAAIVAKQKQQEIEEGQKLKDSVLQQIDAAQALEQQRLKEAEAR